MGIIGFLFNLKEFKLANKLEKVKLNNIKIEKDFLVIFTKTEKINHTQIIGIDYHFKQEETDFIFLDNNLEFQKHLIIGEFRFLYGKISTARKTMLNLKDNTIWFGPQEYKQQYELLEIRDDFDFSEDNFKKKILGLYDYFK